MFVFILYFVTFFVRVDVAVHKQSLHLHQARLFIQTFLPQETSWKQVFLTVYLSVLLTVLHYIVIGDHLGIGRQLKVYTAFLSTFQPCFEFSQ